MAHRILPHGAPREVVPGVHQIRGSLPFPLPRRMTIVQLPGGSALWHSVVAMDEDGMAALEALGRPAVMVVPHPLHLMDAPFYRERYPDVPMVAGADARERLEKQGLRLSADMDGLLAELDVRALPVPGMRYGEVVLDVPVDGGRGLLFTDLISEGVGKSLFMKLAGPAGGAGVPRIVKLRQVRDRRAVRGFLSEVAETPNLAVLTGAHSRAITEDCAAWLRRAAARC